MKITRVEIYHVTLATGVLRFNPILIRIHTDEGITGIGELALAYGVGGSGGAGMVRDMAEALLIGADPLRVEHLWNRLYRRTFWGQGGGPVVYGAMSAIDQALWDIKGKAAGMPVYEMLGGRCHDKLWCYANGWYRGMGSPQEYAEGAQQVVADGFTAMKFDPVAVTPGGEWEYTPRALSRERADLAYERVRAVREAVGPDIEILVEIHGNLGTSSAIKLGKRLEELDPFFYEEPVDAMNVDSMVEVAANVDIPIAAGERLYTRYGFRQYIEKQAVAILQPDVGLAGGISEVRKIANYAEVYNLHVQPHNYASPVLLAASVQVDACIPNFIIQETFPYGPEGKFDLVQRSFESRIVDGYLTPPTEPGLGIEPNMEALRDQDCVTVT